MVIASAATVFSACTAGVAPTTTASAASTTVPNTADTVFVSSDAWSTKPATLFELFSVGASSQPTRLTN